MKRVKHIFISLCSDNQYFSRDDYAQAVIANNELGCIAFQLKRYSPTVKINEIFFMGFEGQSLWSINKKINNLFRRLQNDDTNIVGIIAFIEETLEYFPNCHACYFILARYYAKTGQISLATDSFKTCLQYYGDADSKKLIEKELCLL